MRLANAIPGGVFDSMLPLARVAVERGTLWPRAGSCNGRGEFVAAAPRNVHGIAGRRGRLFGDGRYGSATIPLTSMRIAAHLRSPALRLARQGPRGGPPRPRGVRRGR